MLTIKHRQRLIVMSREIARKILDRYREGDDYPLYIVTIALIATGDIPVTIDSEIQSIIN